MLHCATLRHQKKINGIRRKSTAEILVDFLLTMAFILCILAILFVDGFFKGTLRLGSGSC